MSSAQSSAASISLATLFVGLSLYSMSANAAVSVQGNSASIQVIADKATVSEVLSALGSALRLDYDTMENLDRVIGGTYRGSPNDVLADILRGYNYVIRTHDGSIYLIVIGKVGNFPIASPARLAPVDSGVPPNTNLHTTDSRHTR